MIHIDLQIETQDFFHPTSEQIQQWVEAVFHNRIDDVEICIRLIDKNEMTSLNETYRHKSGPTNILSFPYEKDENETENYLLGDIAICSEIVNAEAKQQETDPLAHWAHIVIHGCLHLLGYDHLTDKDAKEMEELEADILKSLGIEDPYL